METKRGALTPILVMAVLATQLIGLAAGRVSLWDQQATVGVGVTVIIGAVALGMLATRLSLSTVVAAVATVTGVGGVVVLAQILPKVLALR